MLVRLNGAWYVPQKCLLRKLQGKDQNFWIIPRIVTFNISEQGRLIWACASTQFYPYVQLSKIVNVKLQLVSYPAI